MWIRICSQGFKACLHYTWDPDPIRLERVHTKCAFAQTGSNVDRAGHNYDNTPFFNTCYCVHVVRHGRTTTMVGGRSAEETQVPIAMWDQENSWIQLLETDSLSY